ncbi:hypothetical protein SIAM614_09143 [Stappia aggregata IAM 12614]|uniref:Uncharacterized protein n=1 Tax=Roseibium aggregatum (strain ATCC 25650 / DSM 13394 / JCM 20685 / NBRC 16684 / NCIMB 2208 / IAM 12614 / B1) TaxID=384765 RepID=A0NLN6_ROSAI|nr:hypothetical protein SIAM614_09143 [Stappia aggregata IAM 12614] [Roseibium aggregatum IAM 12614]
MADCCQDASAAPFALAFNQGMRIFHQTYTLGHPSCTDTDQACAPKDVQEARTAIDGKYQMCDFTDPNPTSLSATSLRRRGYQSLIE